MHCFFPARSVSSGITINATTITPPLGRVNYVKQSDEFIVEFTTDIDPSNVGAVVTILSAPCTLQPDTTFKFVCRVPAGNDNEAVRFQIDVTDTPNSQTDQRVVSDVLIVGMYMDRIRYHRLRKLALMLTLMSCCVHG